MTPTPGFVVEVHVDLDTGTTLAGTVYFNTRRGQLSSTFTYDRGYVSSPDSFDISPDLPRANVTSVTEGLPGALSDSAPDRWGRNLITKKVQSAAKSAGQKSPTLTEVDYLLGVSDLTRQGALRYRRDDTDFLSIGAGVPKLIELPRLLNAATIVARDARGDDEFAAIKTLLDAGTGSLGGARPKASVRDGGRLLIAKFPHPEDEWDVEAWEATTLDLASAAGIQVPSHNLVDVDGKNVLLLERFDRRDGLRIPYVSGMTLLGSSDGVGRDYTELAEAITELGSRVNNDLGDLWRRVAFSVVVNNSDDHLRNHGFLFEDGGWTLSPMFDVNPNPDLGKERSTSIGFQTDSRETARALMETAPDFGLSPKDARRIWDDVLAATENWRDIAKANGVRERDLDDFAESLDHHRN
jgi:serine/threonine-protein kinase HipA